MYLFPLFIYLSIFEFIFLLKREKQRSCKLLTSFQISNILTNSSYFLRALFSKWIIYRSYNSFVMHQCFKPAVGLLRHWCRKRACSAKSFGISCFVSGCLISSSVSLRLQLKKVRGLHYVLCDLCECVLPEQYSCPASHASPDFPICSLSASTSTS